MPKVVLLRVGDRGEPIAGSKDGVLTFPACPPDPEAQDGPLFKLRVYISAGAKITNSGKLWTDLRPEKDAKFQRSSFASFPIRSEFSRDSFVDLSVYKPGSFAYYFTYVDEGGEEAKTDEYYFVVPPSLTINGKYLTLNELSIQTIVSKWVGNDLSKDWSPLFENVSEKGYNMIHFTPLQERGESNSPYSIYDQLEFDTKIFKNGEEDIKQMVSNLESKYGILSMTDVVFNHTANNSSWIREFPDAGYNAETAPHLTAAIELDGELLQFSKDMSSHGYPTDIKSNDDLMKIIDGIKVHVFGKLKLWEFYTIDVNEHLKEVSNHWETVDKDSLVKIDIPEAIKGNPEELASFIKSQCATQDFQLGVRFGNKLEVFKLISILIGLFGAQQPFENIKDDLIRILNDINLPLYRECDADTNTIVDQLTNRIRFLRLDANGPRFGPIDDENPLTEPYFTRFSKDGTDYALANNGWIWGGNPLVDFASNESRAYLLRQVIVWGDCVKLRYGSKPEDSPHLWERMISYSKLLAKNFHGFRLDNCHSTPLIVAEAMLDAAREVNPNLYVVAELFTGSEDLDILFVKRLGISSLIREAMQSHDVSDLSRLCHKHGGPPIGSFKWLPLDSIAYPVYEFEQKCKEQMIKKSEIPFPQLVINQAPHALFMDCTHDNETPAQKRTVEDTLPTAALVAFCSCATGTTFGFDECYPKLLDVVGEKRKYVYSTDLGISSVKSKLNKIRKDLAQQGYDDIESNEMYIHHEGQYITIQRTNSRTGKGYFLIARTKFWSDNEQNLTPVVLAGTNVKFEFSFALEKRGDADDDDSHIQPIKTELKELEPLHLNYDPDSNATTIHLPDYFPQGSIAVVSTEIPGCNEELDDFVRTGAIKATKNLDLIDLNYILYRAESEERDATQGESGLYTIPNYGPLVYAGIQGWISVLKWVIQSNSLDHPLAEHLRDGKWALDFIINRLEHYESPNNKISEFREWLETRFNKIKEIPYFLVPRYFALVVGVAYEALRFRVLSLMSKEIQMSTAFIQSLAMVSVQVVGLMNNASIHPQKIIPSMAAGLPHFSSDFMRCWGRDVFISTRGLLLATERYDSAKDHILCFAKTLKHGLIPNLLGSGKDPRYNARDAAWFFIQSIQDYINLAPNGYEILNEKVERRFPLDDTYISYDDPLAFSYESTISEIIYEILSRHAGGIDYREANAGPQIDSQMKDEGFNVSIHVDWSTGLVYGGNEWNCGTWMDKMGESEKAGNKGFPGTPRNGADVEINGLLKSALRFVIELNEKGLFDHKSVKNQDGETITFKEWDQLLVDNFERCFYIPADPNDDDQYVIDRSIVNRRGIYKDIFQTSKPFQDYQLRGNFPIAMVVAPELFTKSKALGAIKIADENLRGPVGLRTLDPSDYNYRPNYHNGVDSDDFATSKGRNYHQGPEWVWIAGYFLRAFNDLHAGETGVDVDQMMWNRMEHHIQWLDGSVWAGLTELTNQNGSFCGDSSPTQAWSAACLLDLFLDRWKSEKRRWKQ